MKSIFQADTAADTGTNGRYWCRSERSKEGKQDDGTGLPGRNAACKIDLQDGEANMSYAHLWRDLAQRDLFRGGSRGWSALIPTLSGAWLRLSEAPTSPRLRTRTCSEQRLNW